MKHFIVRSFLDSYEVQISDDVNFIKVPIEVFLEFEPKFKIADEVKQIDYYPEILHEIIMKDNSVKIMDLIWEEGDTYISKVASYS